MPSLPQAPRSSPPGTEDYGLLILLGAIFGLSFLMIKLAVTTVPALPMTTIRLVLASLIMLTVMVGLRHRLPPPGRIWLFIGLSALLGNVLPFLMIAWGQEKVDAGLGAILMSPSPLIAAVLAHLLTSDEKLNRWKLAGVAFGILGVAVLMGIDKVSQIGDEGIRQLAIVTAGAGYAINSVVNRRLTGGSAVGNITAVMIASVVLVAPLSLLAPQSWNFAPSTTSLLAIVAIAVLPTAIGTMMMLAIVRRQGAAFMAQVNFLVPLFGVLWGILFLAEEPTLRSFVGLVLILGGVAVARKGSGLRPGQRPGLRPPAAR